MPNTKEQLKVLIDELVMLGEDQESLLIWVDMFDALDVAEQKALFVNLEREKETLAKLVEDKENS